jgi:hypothetical protein
MIRLYHRMVCREHPGRPAAFSGDATMPFHKHAEKSIEKPLPEPEPAWEAHTEPVPEPTPIQKVIQVVKAERKAQWLRAHSPEASKDGTSIEAHAMTDLLDKLIEEMRKVSASSEG